jgi:hypothetical protein
MEMFGFQDLMATIFKEQNQSGNNFKVLENLHVKKFTCKKNNSYRLIVG